MRNKKDFELKGATPQMEVALDCKVARYLSMEKFENMIEDKAIWFANADSFDDQRERSIPRGFFRNWGEEKVQGYQKINEVADCVIGAYVTCWTKFCFENYALWKVYNRECNGVCVVTPFEKLKKQIDEAGEKPLWASVQYVDLFDDTVQYDLPWIFFADGSIRNTRVKEVYKQQAYEYEKEIRGIIYDLKIDSEKGFSVAIKPEELIDEIYISPFMKDEEERKVINYITEMGLGDRIRKSILLEKKKQE